MAESDERVELTDLDVITRYSLAVRAATADRAELIATLRADLAWLEGGRRNAPAEPPARPARPAAVAKAPAKRPATKAAPVRKAPVRKAPVRKAPVRKASARTVAAKKVVAKKSAKKVVKRSGPARRR